MARACNDVSVHGLYMGAVVSKNSTEAEAGRSAAHGNHIYLPTLELRLAIHFLSHNSVQTPSTYKDDAMRRCQQLSKFLYLFRFVPCKCKAAQYIPTIE